MKRRDSIKSIIVGSVSGGLIIQGCEPAATQEENAASTELEAGAGYGRTPEEQERDAKLRAETFFTPFEMATIAVLADLIIPADEVSGSATEAGVPDFIEFIAKDIPAHQMPLRSGLAWLNLESKDRYGVVFKDASTEQQTAILDDIVAASNAENKEDSPLSPGVPFFNRIRNLVATGFFTSQMGIKDLGYVGNVPNVWDGVPDDVLQKHGFTYEDAMMDKYVKAEERDKLPEWDNEGNLIG